MKIAFPLVAFLSWIPTPLVANEAPKDEERDQLMALLDEQTAIATRTRMNADYVPGMVTVLHGDELEARGARTVWEALALVPGMETAIEKTGRRKVLVRGLGNTWASGNVKVLLNDVSMNSAELGLADPVFNIPVEQVDRIEVIRGPGSAVYGEYAYMGVINVITRADQNRLFTFGGSYNTAGAGATLDLSAKDEPVQASINVAGWRTSGADVRTGRDLVYAFTFPEGAAAVSNAPGRANEDVDAATAVLKLGYQHFSLTAQWAQDGLGDFFGASYFLPPESDRIVERTRHRTVDMRQEIPFGSALVGGIQLSWKDVARARDHQLDYPASSLAEGNYIDSRYLESTTGVTADLSYRGWDKHALLAAVTTSLVRVDKDRSHNSSPVAAPSISVSGMSRQVTAVTVQDEYRHSDLFTLTTGIRYDEYSDVGVRYSPRIAGVWRVDDRNIVKAQYAEAFRPPTLFEIASAAYNAQPQPPAARIRTFEAGYIFREPTAETRVTTFYSTLDDLVVFAHDLSAASGFATQSATSSGVELEQEWRFSSALTFEGNLSRVDTNDEETGAPFPGSAKWLANAGISYRAASFLGAVQAHYVSNYYRQPGDPRPELPGYTTIDVTGSFTRIMGGNAQLRVGIKNLFDAGVRYPAPLVAVRPTPTSTSDVFVPSYAGDYPQAGRTWWLELGYAF